MRQSKAVDLSMSIGHELDDSDESTFEQYEDVEMTDTRAPKTQFRYSIVKEEFPQEMLRAFDAI